MGALSGTFPVTFQTLSDYRVCACIKTYAIKWETKAVKQTRTFRGDFNPPPGQEKKLKLIAFLNVITNRDLRGFDFS